MAGRFRYNTYGPRRTRPMSQSESHWRDMGIKLGLQMRRAPMDPLHQMPLRAKHEMSMRFRQRKMAEESIF